MRLRRGISQGALARPDLSDSYISLLESGKRTPSAAVVGALAQRLDCSTTYLTCGVEEASLTELKAGLASARRALYTGNPEQAIAQVRRLPDNPADRGEPLPTPPLHPLRKLHIEAQHTAALAWEAMGRFGDAIAVLQPLLDTIDPSVCSARSAQDTPSDRGSWWPGWVQWGTLQIALGRCQRRDGDDTLAARSIGPAFTIASLAADGGDVEATEAAVQIGAVLVEVLVDTGEVLLARQTSARLLQLAHDHGHPHARLHAYQQAALVAETLGDLQNAAQWAERALQLLEADEAFHNATEWHARCATLLLRARPDQAERAHDLLGQQLTRAAVSGATPQTLTDLAEAELLLDSADQAAAHARQALHPAADGAGRDETGDSPDVGAHVPARVAVRALAVLAGAYVRLGDRHEAIEALVRRAELLERHGPYRQAAQTWAQVGDLLTGDDVTARRLRFYQRALAAMGLTPHA